MDFVRDAGEGGRGGEVRDAGEGGRGGDGLGGQVTSVRMESTLWW